MPRTPLLPHFSVMALLSVTPCALAEPEAPVWQATALSTGLALSTEVSADGPLFVSLPPSKTGLDFRVPIDNTHPDRRLYYSAMACGATASGDLDGDGLPELFFALGPVPNRLCHQTEPWHFTDIAVATGLALPGVWCTAAALADVDGDGDLDLYVCCHDSPNRLYINSSTPGHFHFEEEAGARGLDLADGSLIPAFCDWDQDGDLDLFLGVNALYHKGGRPAQIPISNQGGILTVLPPWDRFYTVTMNERNEPKFTETGRPNRLYRNEGGGRFTDVSRAAGIRPEPSHTNSASWWDYDHDGWPDLYVANDFLDRDELYRNNRDGTFTELAGDALQHTPWSSMGSAVADWNNDGMADLFVADMLPTTHFREKVTMGDMGDQFNQMRARGLPAQKMANALYLNTGTGLALEAAFLHQVARSDWTWATQAADFDGDGLTDLFCTTGHSRDFTNSDLLVPESSANDGKEAWDHFITHPELRERNWAFRNTGKLAFENVSTAWGLDLAAMSYSATVADLDRDGDQDLVVLNLDDPPACYRNLSRERGTRHALVDLPGGSGATVQVRLASGRETTSTLAPWNGYLQSNEPLLHFGLGAETEIARISVTLPGGATHVWEHLPADSLIRFLPGVTKGSQEGKRPGPPLNPDAFWFAAARRPSPPLLQPERPYQDFARQPLLPHQHSRLGPGLALGDFDGDGRPELALGGPAGTPLRLAKPDGGTWTELATSAFRPASESEDMGVLWFDADGDGDQDVFVVSGGVECDPGAPTLQDRLYLNAGEGRFLPAPEGSVPAGLDSGSVATAADWDRDGDLDLFIGGRIVPGQYPLPARSQLLVNDGRGHFQDLTDGSSPPFSHAGLVTSALWTDADGDGWPDLLLAQEWGPLSLLHNEEGRRFTDRTRDAGLAPHTGWWNSLAGRDLDGDGDIDYVAGNTGLNTKYKTAPGHPELLFYGDLDGTGHSRIVEAKIGSPNGDASDRLLPRRGFSCSSLAMPFLRQKVGTFTNFASSSLEQIYTPERLAKARRFEATTLESAVFLNDGEGHFTAHPLPRLAQISPVFGVVLTDFNADGRTDCFLAQNFFSPQQETGAMDGGLSLLLEGAGDGTFQPLWPLQSGLAIPGDAKSAAVADLNEDGRPDLVLGVNQGPLQTFICRATAPSLKDHSPIRIRLRGTRGNPSAIGARVTVHIAGMPDQTAEIHAGGGYLSQDTPELFFGFGSADAPTCEVAVRWPDGATTRHTLTREAAAAATLDQ